MALCSLGVVLLMLGTAAAETAIGPGVAGQIHALAYDPTDPEIIYAGGDNCGVYRSLNHGETWERWNEGLADDDPRMTSYVDDLLVVPPGTPGIDPMAAGVYAATRGGIAFRREGSGSWEIQTTDLTYDRGYAEGVGAAIPFNCLTFDPVTRTLYAGAGDGRITHESDQVVYPEVDEVGYTEYSLWKTCIDDGCSESWSPVVRFGDQQTALQIAFVVDPDGEPRGVVATTEGVFLQTGNDWDSILNEAIMCSDIDCNYSHIAAGVGVGKDGVIWALTRREGNHDPGVYRLTPTEYPDTYVYDNPWEQPGEFDTEKVPPQGAELWLDIVHAWGDNDFKTLTVVPGTEDSQDEVFVGMEPAEIPADGSSYNGYFRYGECGDGATRWVNILFRDGEMSWDHPDVPFSYASYDGSSVVEHSIPEMGWLPGFTTGSTVQLQVSPYEDPSDDDEYADWMFASLYHYPMVTEFGTDVVGWEQRYCDGSGGLDGYYSSKGLNIMSARSIGFTDSDQLVIGCGDFLGFITQTNEPTGSGGFLSMDPYYAAEKENWDTEIVGDEIYMVRSAPILWGANSGNDPTNWFQYDTVGSGADERCRQTDVIALYDESIDQMDGLYGGYRWRYISQGLDLTDFAVFTGSGTYAVTDIEIVDPDAMFAVVRNEAEDDTIFKGVRTAGTDPWTWSAWWTTVGDADWEGEVRELLRLPGTERLLVVATDNECLIELSVANSSIGGGFTPIVWIDRYDEGLDQWDRFTMSLKNLTGVACDEHGEWLYLIASGQEASGYTESGYLFPYEDRCANVLRASIPADGDPPAPSDWDCILNSGTYGAPVDGIVYQSVDVDYWPDNFPIGGSRVAECLPLIETIAVHPDNPRRVFIGIRASGFKAPENFHPNNGVWEFVPSGDGGQWSQIKGDGAPAPNGEPCKGVRTLALVPGSPGQVVAGSFGQEFFLVDSPVVSPPPVVGMTALEAIHAEQTLLMVTLEGAAGDIAEMRIDASSLGLSPRLQFDDDGPAGGNGDWEAGDGIWTANVDGYVAQVFGAQPLPVYARDADWNSFYGEVEVEVLAEVPAVYYRNVSPDVDFTYDGTPAGVTPVDLFAAPLGVDSKRDIFMSKVGTGAAGTLLLHPGSDEPVPQYLEAEIDRFGPGNVPGQGNGPATAVDLDGDGLQDLIVPAGQDATAGLRFYKQLADGSYELQPGWNPLSAASQQNTWVAACADYDGDGYLDIYLGRATAGTSDLPDPGSTALADILLRNNLYRSASFVDATDEVTFAADLATGTATWCDYDADGDLDLAIADCATGGGVHIYENDLSAGSARFELAYRSDTDNPAWTAAVSDMAWIGTDDDPSGDAGLDLLVTSPGDQDGPVLVTYENGAFTWDLALVASATAAASGVRVLDLDRDGDLDFALLPLDDDDVPRFAVQTDGDFAIATSVPGMVVFDGSSHGALVADLTGDGAQDLFLGRPQQTERFLATVSAPPQNWAGLRLLDDSRGYAPAYGARVVLSTGVAMSVGCNGRSDPTFIFGLGGETSIACTIYWPTGHVETATLNAGEVATMLHQTTFAADFDFVGTPTCKPVLQPQGFVDLVFRWSTTTQSDLFEDTVVSNGVELKKGVANVQVRQWFEWYDGAPVYRHEVRLNSAQCLVGTSPFTVESRRGTIGMTSDEATLRIRVCTSNQIPQE